MIHLPITRRLKLAAAAWHPGVKMDTIIVDGWSRGFQYEQTLFECVQAGYSACLAEPAIRARWATMDAEYLKACEAEQSPCDPASFASTF